MDLYILPNVKQIASGSSRIAQGDQLGVLVHLVGWDSEGGRETQDGGDMGTYVYV